MNPINIVLKSAGGLQLPVVVPAGADVGHVRTLQREIQEVGAPSSFTFAVNAVGVEDSYILQEGDAVSFRPKAGEKGAA